MTSDPDCGAPPDPIEAMAAALAASNPTLYRHLALYLQVLRQVLPARVEQACFHLATQVHPQRYAALAAPERQALHARILALVQRCSSLLTVEQLTALADQMDREAMHRQRRQQRELLESLSGDVRRDEADHGDPQGLAGGDPQDSGPNGGGHALPAGSIRLDFSLPLSSDIGGWRAMAPPADVAGFELPERAEGSDPPGPQAHQPCSERPPSGHLGGSPAGGAAPFLPAHGNFDDATDDAVDEDGDADAAADDDLDGDDALDDVLSELAAIGADGSELEADRAESREESLQQRLAQGPDTAAILRIVRQAMEEPRDPQRRRPALPLTGPPSPWREARLPRDPVTLLRWLDGVEKALLRRLRNLSHALNVELLRVGISRGLLPVSLLDAVLEGQVDTMAAPSNVLHLQMPFSLRPGTAEVHALAILLRPVDLEMDEPRLRTCRRRLQQQRQELRRMAHQFRRLQRRLQAHEAERLWLQDIRNSRPPRT